MRNRNSEMKQVWEKSFKQQINDESYNTSPVEALIRNVAYFLRERYKKEEYSKLHFLEMGCGTGPNLLWLAQKGIKVSGIDISPLALGLCKKKLLEAGFKNQIINLNEGSVTQTGFASESFDGIIESCVFQHLNKNERTMAFDEVKRLLKPGGVFVGYMLAEGHTVFENKKSDQLKGDKGSLILEDKKSDYYLTNIGLSHFFSKNEFNEYFKGFSVIDPCNATYYLPKEEAKKRGYEDYLQCMWIVYAIK